METGSLPPYELVRQSCQELFQSSSGLDLPVTFNVDGTRLYAKEVNVALVREKGSSLAQDANFTRVDATFPSIIAEAGLIVLMHALDFGGGWRKLLHAHHQKGAWITVKAGIEALYRENPRLEADWLASQNVHQVITYFSLPTESDAELRPFAVQLTKVIHELGTQIQKDGASTMAEWLADKLQRNTNSSTPAGDLVQNLVETFPFTFNDSHQVNLMESISDVYFYKKAQLVVGELFHRFREEDPRFSFADGDRLTAYIDNVICAVCRKLGLVVVSPSFCEKIESGQVLPSGSLEEVCLRAASMIAVEYVSKTRASDGLTPVECGNYFWGVLGKSPEFRKFQRHATRDTVFY